MLIKLSSESDALTPWCLGGSFFHWQSFKNVSRNSKCLILLTYEIGILNINKLENKA